MMASSPSVRVFQRATSSGRKVRAEQHTLAQSRQLLTSETVVGQTPHFVVYTDGLAEGDRAAQAVLAACEADYMAVRTWFGSIDLPARQDGDDQTTVRAAQPVQPLHVLMDPNAGGAYHFALASANLYIEPAPANQASALVVSEVVELFEATINNGWDGGHTNGESLSRVLAVERNANLASVIVPTETSWWRNGHRDYVTVNTATDQNEDANGCGALFLCYLHTQLGFSWTQIATTGGSSLGDTYQKLTGNDSQTGFRDFLGRLATIAHGRQLNIPSSGNPFPIRSTGIVPPTGGSLPTARNMEIVVAVAAILVIVAAVVAILLVLGLVPGAF
ncbi:MAG TPA: hypothetical protein VGF38_09460 [Ktedonobacterales bacterium]|jgi:hypothetical protein